MAQVVSRSPSALTVSHSASSKERAKRAAAHTQNGTVSGAETWEPFRPHPTYRPGRDVPRRRAATSRPWRVAPCGVRAATSRTKAGGSSAIATPRLAARAAATAIATAPARPSGWACVTSAERSAWGDRLVEVVGEEGPERRDAHGAAVAERALAVEGHARRLPGHARADPVEESVCAPAP